MTLFNSSLSVGREIVPVTPGAAALASTVRALYVGGDGNVVARGLNGVDVTFVNVPAGSTLLGEFTHILAATTATNLVGYV